MGYIHHVVNRRKDFENHAMSKVLILEERFGENHIPISGRFESVLPFLEQKLRRPKCTLSEFMHYFSVTPVIYDERYIDVYYNDVVQLRTKVEAKKLVNAIYMGDHMVGFCLYEALLNPLHSIMPITSLQEIRENPIVLSGKDKERVFHDPIIPQVHMTHSCLKSNLLNLLKHNEDIYDYYTYAPYIQKKYN